jgi:transposase
MERLRRRQFTAEFKLEAARYVLDQGMSFAEVGKRLGVLPKLVRDWVVKYEAGELVAGAPKLRVTPEQMELSELRQEVQRLRMERDILKKAAVGSTGQCNTICSNRDLEGGVYGTNGATRTVSFPEGGAVASMEVRAVIERYWRCAGQTRGVDSLHCCV